MASLQYTKKLILLAFFVASISGCTRRKASKEKPTEYERTRWNLLELSKRQKECSEKEKFFSEASGKCVDEKTLCDENSSYDWRDVEGVSRCRSLKEVCLEEDGALWEDTSAVCTHCEERGEGRTLVGGLCLTSQEQCAHKGDHFIFRGSMPCDIKTFSEIARTEKLPAETQATIQILTGMAQDVMMKRGLNYATIEEWMKGVESLDPYNFDYSEKIKTRIESVGPFTSFVKLKRLSLREQAVADLTPLAKLVALEELDLTGNRVKDLSPLRNLKKLKKLKICRNPLGESIAIDATNCPRDINAAFAEACSLKDC